MILKGKQIYLKEGISNESYRLFLNWFGDIEVVKYLSFGKRFLRVKTESDLKKMFTEIEPGAIFEIITIGGVVIGYTSLEDHVNKDETEYGIIILDKNYWGKGIGEECTKLILAYAFDVLGLKKIVLETSEFHKMAISLYEKCGFHKTKLIPEDRTVFHNGKWLLSGTVEMEINSEKQ